MDERRQTKQCRARVRQHPGKVSYGSGRLFEHSRVSLDEEDVEDELEAEGAKVDERRQESPVLFVSHRQVFAGV